MPTVYRIHPGVGVARLGNSPDAFCIAAEKPGALPIECDADGNALPLGSALGEEMPVRAMKDGEGRVKRQAARFGVWVYDDENPGGRPLAIGDEVAGGGNHGTLVDVQWRVHLANKKASWYEFLQLQGEHGYAADHPRRNPGVTAAEARQRLIIDPGPRVVSLTGARRASFSAAGGAAYAATFPPPLQPRSIETLGDLLTDDAGRLLVLGGHGSSGSYRYDDFGQPRIDHYANNDGWFDDTSDGPVMARLVFFSEEVQQQRFIDVEYPAWVIAGYPDYVPQIPDIVTMDELVYDLAVRRFAYRTDLYGEAGSYDCPEHVDPTDTTALVVWQAGRLGWNPDHRPWFYRDIWPILWRPEQYFWLTSVLSASNDPHNQTARGTFDPARLGVPPVVDWEKVGTCLRGCLAPEKVAELFVAPLEAVLKGAGVQSGDQGTRGVNAGPEDAPPAALLEELRDAVAAFAARARGEGDPPADGTAVADAFAGAAGAPERGEARSALQEAVGRALDALGPAAAAGPAEGTAHATRRAPVYNSAPDDRRAMGMRDRAEVEVQRQLRRLYQGDLHRECFRRCVAANTQDVYGPDRQFLFALLREPGEENVFAHRGRATTRVFNLPLMPLLSGDNPISNVLPSKFLRLTDYQHYLLRQWAAGKFVNELTEGWVASADPDDPYAGWKIRTGRDLDQGVLHHVVGGAFCPGGEVGWIMRNPAIWLAPWRVRADPAFSSFTLTAAQANAWRGNVPETDYISYADAQLSQDDDLDSGMQPGDLTKHMALPWQSDFNECSSQTIDVTYDLWNVIDYTNPRDSLLERQQRTWETLWWPAHRPMQNYELQAVSPDGSRSYRWLDWARGVTQTVAGDLKMVTEWDRLPFVLRNDGDASPGAPSFVGVERTPSR